VRKADNLQPSFAFVTKSGNLNFLEPCGPLRACNGTVFALLTYRSKRPFICLINHRSNKEYFGEVCVPKFSLSCMWEVIWFRTCCVAAAGNTQDIASFLLGPVRVFLFSV